MSFTRNRYDPITNHIKELELKARGDDIVYLNMNIGIGQSGSVAVPATVSIAASTPIIENPQDYYCSIVRLETPQLNIPIGYAKVVEPVVNVNETVYTFSLEWNGNLFSSTVQWICPINNYPVPVAGPLQVKSPYYFIQNYQQFINLWNTALLDCFTQMQAVNPIPSGAEPNFYYNPTTQVIELYAESQYYDENLSVPIYIYCSGELTPYIDGFDYQIDNLGSSNKKIKFNLRTTPSVTLALNTVEINSITYIKSQQEFTNGQVYWNALKRIVITSSMNIVQESGVSTRSINTLTSGQNVTQLNILTDFIPDTSGAAGSAKSTYVYNASALWRLFTFNQKTALVDISVSMLWIDADGYAWNLLTFPGISPSIKFMFIKKSLINLSQNGNIGRL